VTRDILRSPPASGHGRGALVTLGVTHQVRPEYYPSCRSTRRASGSRPSVLHGESGDGPRKWRVGSLRGQPQPTYTSRFCWIESEGTRYEQGDHGRAGSPTWTSSSTIRLYGFARSCSSAPNRHGHSRDMRSSNGTFPWVSPPRCRSASRGPDTAGAQGSTGSAGSHWGSRPTEASATAPHVQALPTGARDGPMHYAAGSWFASIYGPRPTPRSIPPTISPSSPAHRSVSNPELKG